MRRRIADVTLRPWAAEDDDFIESLSQRVFRMYAGDPTRTTRAIVHERGAETVIAELGRTRLGFVVVHYEELGRDFGPWTRPVVARINAIAVRPDAQGRGVGRALVRAAEIDARSRDARALSLMTAERNAPARRLFESSGFMPLARIEDAYIDGQRAIAMTKPLL